MHQCYVSQHPSSRKAAPTGWVPAAIILTAVSSACGAAGNPLLGKWRYTGQGYVDREGTHYCDNSTTEMQFTPTTLIRWNAPSRGNPASTDSQPVNYLVNGSKVYVSSAQHFGSGQYWDFVDAHTIRSDNMDQCVFVRE